MPAIRSLAMALGIFLMLAARAVHSRAAIADRAVARADDAFEPDDRFFEIRKGRHGPGNRDPRRKLIRAESMFGYRHRAFPVFFTDWRRGSFSVSVSRKATRSARWRALRSRRRRIRSPAACSRSSSIVE